MKDSNVIKKISKIDLVVNSQQAMICQDLIKLYIYKINKIKTNALSSNTKWQMGAQSHLIHEDGGLPTLRNIHQLKC